MKTTPSRTYDQWTPDMQVTALKRCAYAVLIFVLGLSIFAVQTQLLDLPTGLDIGLFMLVFACHTIAFVCYASGGMLIDFGPFLKPRFQDEFCREVLFKAYQATAWVLLVSLGFSWFTLSYLLQWVGVEQVNAGMVAGSFLVLGVMTWAIVVLRELRDTDAESEE